MSDIKGRGNIAVCIYQLGKTKRKEQYEHILVEFQILHLEAAEQFDNMHHLFASYVFLENEINQVNVTITDECERSKNSMQLCFVSETNGHI